MKIIAAADGSALGNPGPAGWGWYSDAEHWACGGWPHGTNNMGELMAVLDLLQQTAHLDADVHVLCDSKYVIDSVTKWMPGWKKNGWKKKDKKPVLNVELMKGIDAAKQEIERQGRNVTFEWVKGHAGHALNEEADRLANGAARAYQAGRVPAPGPGWEGAATAHPDARVGQIEEEPDLFSVLSAADLADSTPAPVTSTVDEVVAAERALLDDEVRSDRAAVAGWLHPDWLEIDASGRLWTRDELLAEIQPLGPVRLEVVETSEPSADTMLLVWRAIGEHTALRSSLWVRVDGRWLQRFAHGTREP